MEIVDVSRQPLTDQAIRAADFVGFYLPMHTATRLAAPLIEKVRAVNSAARLCAYGLYAPLNADWLRSLGLRAVDSDANFVLFGTFADRHAVWQALLDDGVLIRETGPDGWLRVSIGTGEEMASFRASLERILKSDVGRLS